MKTNPGSVGLLALCWLVFFLVLAMGLALAASHRIEIPVSGLWEWLP